MLNISQANKTFNLGTLDERRALVQVDLKLESGTFAVVIGGNGAGKSTLLNAIAGEIVLDTGKVTINGTNVTGLATHNRAKWVARVFQDPMIGTAPSMTVEENLTLAELRGKKHTLSAGLNPTRRQVFRDRLSQLGLGLEDRISDRVGSLSGGQRQSLSLIMAVMTQPKILLLDEHSAALDPRTGALVMRTTVEAVERAKLTTIMVTHNMQHAIDYGDRLIMMDAGRIILDMEGKEKAEATVEGLVHRFHITDDKMLLQDT